MKLNMFKIASMALVLTSAIQTVRSQTPYEIMKNNFLTAKVLDSQSEATFHLINASGQERVRETKSYTKLIASSTDNMRTVEFLSPADIRGTKTLLIEHSGKDDDIWIYLPAMKKVRRLVSNNKKDAFVGTDFSYGDVIGHKPEDWNHTKLREETISSKQCYVIESTPKNLEVKNNSGYSKRITWIDKQSFATVKNENYDMNGELLKVVTYENTENVDAQNNKWQAMKLTAENVQNNHKTIITFKNFKANVGVKNETFTTSYLEQ